MVTAPESTDEPPISSADLTSGAWLTNTPEERDTYLRLLRAGLNATDALYAAQHAIYLHGHVLRFLGNHLSAAAFADAEHAARAVGMTVIDYLARRGFPLSSDSARSEDPQEAAHAYNRRLQAAHDRWAGSDDASEQGPQGRTAGRSAPNAVKVELGATRAAFAAARGLGRENPGRPSHTYSGRRRRYLAGLVAKGMFPDIDTADRMTPRRGKE